MTGADLAAAAQALVGTPFRLHGRCRRIGLDCVGLVGASLEACGRQPHYPQGYRLRNAAIARWMEFADLNGLTRAAGPVLCGDIVLTRPGPGQHHLLVALGHDRFVHAHAGLRKVVAQHPVIDTPPLARWRAFPDAEQTWQH